MNLESLKESQSLSDDFKKDQYKGLAELGIPVILNTNMNDDTWIIVAGKKAYAGISEAALKMSEEKNNTVPYSPGNIEEDYGL